MVILGIDAHKRSHTVVVIDEHGRQLATKTIATATADHLGVLHWAEQFGPARRWAGQDCRHLSRRLERDLLTYSVACALGCGEPPTEIPLGR